jgi:hypothetical protein
MIEGTVPVNRQMLGEVYELIDIFPYFQSAHLLLLKGLQQSADVKFENQLRNSAIHVGDREVLYWLLKTKNSNEEEKTSIKKEPIEFKEEITSDTQQTVIESAKNSEYMINEIEKESNSEKPDEGTGFSDHGRSIMVGAEPDNKEPAGVVYLLDEDIVASDNKVVYMDPGFFVPEHSDLLELDLDEDISLISLVPEDVSENHDVADKNSKKLIQSELIDKFIIANPRIETIRDKTIVITEDISKHFVEESGGLVTETLAKIYVNQGYYSKAIDIYEKLSLKFPEKSSYFASQIEKVKEYIKK